MEEHCLENRDVLTAINQMTYWCDFHPIKSGIDLCSAIKTNDVSKLPLMYIFGLVCNALMDPEDETTKDNLNSRMQVLFRALQDLHKHPVNRNAIIHTLTMVLSDANIGEKIAANLAEHSPRPSLSFFDKRFGIEDSSKITALGQDAPYKPPSTTGPTL